MTSRSISSRLGFSLVEVVVATGILAVSIFVVVGLFAPVAKFSGDVTDSNSATHLVGMVSEELYRLPYVEITSPTFSQGELFASPSGDRIGVVLGTGEGEVPEGEAYFRIAFVRDNEPAADGYAEFTMTMQWPYRLPDGALVETNQQLLVFKVLVPPSR